MRLGFASPISLHLMKDLVAEGDSLPIGYEFAPAVDWVRLLLRRGHEVTVYTTAKDVEKAEKFHGDRLTIRIAKQRVWGTGKDLFGAERRQLTAMMKEDQCDVIHAHWTYEFALASLASGIPTLVTVHDLPWNVLRFFKDKFRTAKLLVAYAVAFRGKYFSAVSTDAAAHFRHYFAPWAHVEVISNGLPDAVFEMSDPLQDASSLMHSFCTILRGWSARKNAEVALQAFGLLRVNVADASLIMFGKDYEAGGPAEVWAKENSLSDGVVFVGELPYRQLLERINREAGILVHPSLDESFSMAAAEAMALRKPVIAGEATPGVREVLNYGQAGILVDMTKPDAVAAEMTRLATDKAYYWKFASLGYQRASSTYRTEAVFGQYENLYTRIARDAGRA
jgi:glycosyltransferase involved in cell wall biosynthesis